MRQLVFGDGIYSQLCSLSRTFQEEFAVTLFGEVRGNEHYVTHIAPPGKNASSSWARCTNDKDFEAAFFERLQKDKPEIEWLGDLHAHPPGFAELSSTDRRTIRKILLGDDDTLHPDEYVAGVMLRNDNGIDIYPMHFDRQNLAGSPMEVRYEGICQKPERAGSLIFKAYRHCRSWIARQRARRHGSASRRGSTHADRP